MSGRDIGTRRVKRRRLRKEQSWKWDRGDAVPIERRNKTTNGGIDQRGEEERESKTTIQENRSTENDPEGLRSTHRDTSRDEMTLLYKTDKRERVRNVKTRMGWGDSSRSRYRT